MAQALLKTITYPNRYQTPVNSTNNYVDQYLVRAYQFNDVVDFVNDLETRVQDLEDGTSTTPLIVTDTTDATTKDTGSIITEGGIGVEKAIVSGTSITATTQLRVSATSNQIRLGNIAANDVIISSTAPAADSVYTIPDAGTAANFIMSESAQTINGIKTFGGQTIHTAGTVSAPGLVVGVTDNGLYEISGTQLGISVGNTLVGGFNGLGLFTDIIAEQTAAAGVTIDTALIKDGSFSINGNYARLKPIAAKQALVGAGAVTLTQWYTTLDTNAGAAAVTLANAVTIGQTKKIQMIVDGGDATLTPTSLSGGTTITFADAGDFAILTWNGTAWVAEELGNDADGVTAPVLA